MTHARSFLALALWLATLPAFAQDLTGRWFCDVQAADAGAFLTLDFGRMGGLQTEFRLALIPPRYGLYEIAGEARLRYQIDGADISQRVQSIRIDPAVLQALPLSERGNFERVFDGIVRRSLDHGAFLPANDGTLVLRADPPFNAACQRV